MKKSIYKKLGFVMILIQLLILNCSSTNSKSELEKNNRALSEKILLINEKSKVFDDFIINNEKNDSILLVNPTEKFTASIVGNITKECDGCGEKAELKTFEDGVFKTIHNFDHFYKSEDSNSFYPSFKKLFKNDILVKSFASFEKILERRKSQYKEIDPFKRSEVKNEDEDFLYNKKKYAFIELKFEINNYSLETKKYKIDGFFNNKVELFITPEVAKEAKESGHAILLFQVEIGSPKEFKYIARNCTNYNQSVQECLKFSDESKGITLFNTTVSRSFLVLLDKRFPYEKISGSRMEIGTVDVAVINKVISLKIKKYSDYLNLNGNIYLKELFADLDFFKNRINY